MAEPIKNLEAVSIARLTDMRHTLANVYAGMVRRPFISREKAQAIKKLEGLIRILERKPTL